MIHSYIHSQKEAIFQTYRELHQIAEASGKEVRTSAYLQEKMKQFGYEITTYAGHHGFTAELKGNSSEVVALRADMDAVVQDVNGEVKANHSCGHDAHSTMLLFTAAALTKLNIKPEKTIRFIFQPAEETMTGALQMIESGALTGVTKLAGIHLRPAFEVQMGMAAPIILHGSAATLHGKIRGKQAHAARPELGINAIEAASEMVQALKGIHLEKERDYSVKITRLHAGSNSTNIIPDEAVFSLDLRSAGNDGMNELIERTEHVLESTARLSGTDITWNWAGRTFAAIENENMIKAAQHAVISVLGKENLAPPCKTKGGEDFHFYPAHCENIASTMIGLGCGMKHGLHHPDMEFELEALMNGVGILTGLALRLASVKEKKD